MPTVRSVGAVASGTAAQTPALPSGWQQDDILIVIGSTANEAFPTWPPTGYTNVANPPTGFGTAAAAGGLKLWVAWKRATSSESAPAPGDSGSYQVLRMLAVQGCIKTGDPWDATATANQTSANTSVSWPDITTTGADRLIIGALGGDRDATSTADVGSVSNANLANITDLIENWVTSGAGGGIYAFSGEKAAAGAIGASTASITSQVYSTWIGALKPDPNVALAGGATGGATATGALTVEAPDTSVRVSFPTPASNLSSTANAQRFRVTVRSTDAGSTPTVALKLYEGGAFVATLATGVGITSTSAQVVEATWSASALAAISGANVELLVEGTHAGHSTVEIGAIEWSYVLAGAGEQALAGGAVTSAQAAAALSVAKLLAGAATGSAQAAAALAVVKTLEGTAMGGAQASGGLAITDNLVGAAVAGAIAAAGIELGKPLQGAATAGATAQGALTLVVPLAGAAVGSAAATGDLDQQAPDTLLRVSFPSPPSNLSSGANAQAFRVTVRKTGAANPTVTLKLYEGGAFVTTLATAVSVTSATSQVVEALWSASALSAISGANVELQIEGTHSGYSTVEIGAVEWLYALEGAGSQALVGAATGGAAAAADLTHVVTLSGAAIVSASAGAAISHGVPLAGAAIAGASASASLQGTVPLAGAATGGATASGQLLIAIALSGDAVASALASATLTGTIDGGGDLPGAVALAGAATAGATAAGALSVSKPLAGAATAGAAAAATLVLDIHLAGSAIAAAAASGALTAIGGSSLAGDAVAGALASANLTHGVPIAGAATVGASGSANLALSIALSGAAIAAAQATGALVVTVALGGAAITTSAASGALQLSIGLQGAAVAGAVAAAAFPDSTLVPVERYTIRAPARRLTRIAPERAYTTTAPPRRLEIRA